MLWRITYTSVHVSEKYSNQIKEIKLILMTVRFVDYERTPFKFLYMYVNLWYVV